MAAALLPLLLLLLHLFAVGATAVDVSRANITGFWSIDCGGSKPFIKPYGIPWVNDTWFVPTGHSHPIDPKWKIDYLPGELENLRAFPTKRKNCFTIPVVEGTKLLARVKFYYGNYDKLQKPPSFDLIFDADIWRSVSTEMKKIVMHEAVYVARRNGTSICVGRHGSAFPFVSSIEIRTLSNDMYDQVGSDRALYLARSVAYGVEKTLRYPDDPLDRLWARRHLNLDGNGFASMKRTNNVKITDTDSSSRDCPPLAAFDAAVKPLKHRKNLTIETSRFPLMNPTSIYVNMYFTEMEAYDPNRTGAFHVIMNKHQRISRGSIAPPYGKIHEFTYFTLNTEAEHPNLVFDLMQDGQATRPPIINAMELFTVSPPLHNMTNITDVEGLGALQEQFPKLRDWSGDPCRPDKYNWEWVACNRNSTPRITELRLTGYGLYGPLPDFSALTALETILLDGNRLNGKVPDFIASLPHLKMLNLSQNNFSFVPNSLLKNKNIILDISKNKYLCNVDPACLETENDAMTNGAADKEPNMFSMLFFISLATLLVVLGMAQ